MNEMDDRGREMFFLLRMAFWLGLVLVLLPLEKTPEPAACEVGGQAATAIGHRAQAGARKLYQIITDKRASDHTSSIGGIENADASLAETASHDTLTPNDLQAEWRGVP
jgi:hypothetical protein